LLEALLRCIEDGVTPYCVLYVVHHTALSCHNENMDMDADTDSVRSVSTSPLLLFLVQSSSEYYSAGTAKSSASSKTNRMVRSTRAINKRSSITSILERSLVFTFWTPGRSLMGSAAQQPS
jgi:hypothetical protein